MSLLFLRVLVNQARNGVVNGRDKGKLETHETGKQRVSS